MNSKTVDVDLRIRARNLSKATISEITNDVDRLTKAQKEQATAAGLAAKSAKELAAQQQFLAAAEKELARRTSLGEKYKTEQAEIKELAQRIRELTEARKKLADAPDTKKSALGSADRDITKTNKQMDLLVQKNEETAASMKRLGVNVESLDADLEKLGAATAAAGAAKQRAIADVQRYGAAVQHTSDIVAEATRRQEQEAAVARRRNTAATQIDISDRNRRVELAAMREQITASLEAGRQREIEAEAARRLSAEITQETNARQRNITGVVAEKNRMQELAALRRDIIARSGQVNAAEERESRVLAESNARRDRLIRLLQTERGQRIQAAEAARGQAAAVDQESNAQGRNATATGRAAAAQGLFNDRGRESLSTYQRVRGQILSLVAAYVGVYEAINTVTKAVAATNRDQSLRIGLRVGAEGNEQVAAKNYAMLRKEADRLGLVFDDVAPKFVNLDIAGQKAGLSANQTAEAFKNLSIAAAARNLSLDDTEGAFRAIEQMFSKGKVQAEELRGQLAERLPGAVAIFAQASGKSLSQLDKDLEQGRVGLDFVVRGLRAYASQFDSEMGNLTERLSAYINRAKNSYNDWLRTLMNGENQDRLKRALSEVTNFFKGEDGVRFAQALSEAFGALVEAFILLAKNVDLVTGAMKAFVAIQAVKFLSDIIVSLRGAAAAFVAYRAAATAAATATGGVSVAAKGLLALTGPVGAALAALGAGYVAYTAAVDKAERRTQDFIDTLQRAGRARTTDEISKSMTEVSDGIKDSNRELGELIRIRDKLGTINPVNQIVGGFQAYAKDAYTLEEINLKIVAEEQKRAAFMERQVVLQKQLGKAAAEEAEARKKLNEEPIPTTPAKAAKTPKVAAGPDPESVRDRVLKMTEDLRTKLAQVEVQANARTAEQIQQNYESRLAIIKSEVAKAEIQIGAIQRAAAASNKGKGTELTAELTTLRGALDAYREAAIERANEDKIVANIRLQEQELQKLIDIRASKLQLINTLQENGAITTGEAWAATFKTTEEQNALIRANVQEFLAMLQTIDPSSDLYTRLGIDKLIAGLQQTQAEAAKAATMVKRIGLYLADDVASGAADAFVTLGKGLAGAVDGANSLGDAFKGALDQFRNFAADFLQNIAKMIIQALILQAIQNAINGTSGGYGQAIGAVIGAKTKHQGGMVGGPDRTNPTRMVSPAVFAGAQRWHEGGLPGSGLKPGEVPTILRVGEEVVTEDNPRHVNNYEGGASASPITLQNNIMIDPAEMVQAAMATPAGSKTLMTWLSANKSGVKSAIG